MTGFTTAKSERLGGDCLDGPRLGLMAGDAEGHHDRYHPDDDVGDAASGEAQAGEHVVGAGSSADLLPEPPPPRRREDGRP
jgi:hypothetical protein